MGGLRVVIGVGGLRESRGVYLEKSKDPLLPYPFKSRNLRFKS